MPQSGDLSGNTAGDGCSGCGDRSIESLRKKRTDDPTEDVPRSGGCETRTAVLADKRTGVSGGGHDRVRAFQKDDGA